jgi:AcrR family transcriptional regulator
VYRHFPDEDAIFKACSSHWLQQNPPPDLSAWTAADPVQRLSAALEELYAWYRRTEEMRANVLRDGPLVPALAARLQEWEGFMQACCDVLARGWGARGRRRTLVLAAIGHAVDFHTWVSLARQGLDDREAAGLMTQLAVSAREGVAPAVSAA